MKSEAKNAIIPSRMNPSTGKMWENYQPDVARIRESVLNGTSVIAVFGYQDILADEEGKDWMQDVAGDLPILVEFEDGIIFGLK